MIKTIEQMTCEELTAAYVILRNLENIGKNETDINYFNQYISHLKRFVVITHEEKLEDMRKEFYEGRTNNVQH